MLLFEFPKDTVMDVKFPDYYCPVCSKRKKNGKLKVKTTDQYRNLENERLRFCLVFHNPYCSCSNGIWLGDGEIEVN